MVLDIKRLALAAAVAVLVATPACKQSLFDEHVDPSDAGGGGGDGDPPATCPEPCVGDAVGHYNGSQGGTTGAWRYHEGERSETGLTHGDMTAGMWHTMPGFVGLDQSTAILPCNDDNQDAMECAGLLDTILLSPSETGGTNGTYPALSWRASASGAFRISGDFAAPETYEEGIQERLVIYRNGRNDTLYTRTFTTSHTLDGFDFAIEAYAGDDIRLAILANTMQSIPIGVDFYVTDLAMPGECQLLMTFDGQTDLTDHCQSAAYTNSNDPANGEPPTTAASAPPGMPRFSRTFVEGSFLQPGGPALDYSGDWTIQFWVNMASMPWTTEAIYADWNCAAKGGVNFARNDTNMYFSMFHYDAANDYCTTGDSDFAIVPVPSSDVWHFVRVTRSTADEMVYVCIDGARRGQIPVPGDATMSSDTAPWLGRNVDYNPAYFRGSLADVRVFTRTLPCPTLP